MTLRISYRWLLAALLVATAAFGVLALPRAMQALAGARGRLADAQLAQAWRIPAASRTSPDPGALAERLRTTASATGLLIESITSRPPGDTPLACVEVTASGKGRAILRFAAAMETGAPPVRFLQWRVTGDGGVVRLTAHACQVDRL